MFENFDIEVCEVFKEAERQRDLLHHEYVGTEHLLLAILKNENDFTNSLGKFKLTYNDFISEVKNTLSSVKRKVSENIYTPLLKRVIANAQKN